MTYQWALTRPIKAIIAIALAIAALGAAPSAVRLLVSAADTCHSYPSLPSPVAKFHLNSSKRGYVTARVICSSTRDVQVKFHVIEADTFSDDEVFTGTYTKYATKDTTVTSSSFNCNKDAVGNDEIVAYGWYRWRVAGGSWSSWRGPGDVGQYSVGCG